jgi:hypothetical protein
LRPVVHKGSRGLAADSVPPPQVPPTGLPRSHLPVRLGHSFWPASVPPPSVPPPGPPRSLLPARLGPSSRPASVPPHSVPSSECSKPDAGLSGGGGALPGGNFSWTYQTSGCCCVWSHQDHRDHQSSSHPPLHIKQAIIALCPSTHMPGQVHSSTTISPDYQRSRSGVGWCYSSSSFSPQFQRPRSGVGFSSLLLFLLNLSQ